MKKQFLMNILLSMIWIALTGSLAISNFVFGFALSFLIMWVVKSGDVEQKKYFVVIPRVISFVFYFLYELIKANIQVAYDVITPKFYMTPGIVCVPLDAKTDIEITLLANIISLTPGTLSLDVSDDRKVLYVHSMYIRDKDEFIREIKSGFERKLLQIMR
jgi:multicomponent Na+:H+ antiporter subunit E